MANRRDLLRMIAASGAISGTIASKAGATSKNGISESKPEFKLSMDQLSEKEFESVISSEVISEDIIKNRMGVVPIQQLSEDEHDIFNEIEESGPVVIQGEIPSTLRENRLYIKEGDIYRVNILPTV